MAIINYQCKQCDKNAVCKVYDILKKFDEEQKTQLGVNITMNECFNFNTAEGNDE